MSLAPPPAGALVRVLPRQIRKVRVRPAELLKTHAGGLLVIEGVMEAAQDAGRSSSSDNCWKALPVSANRQATVRVLRQGWQAVEG